MWSWQKKQNETRNPSGVTPEPKRNSKDAVPQQNTLAYTVPNYRRGSPYSKEAVPTYSDSPTYGAQGKHPYDTPTAQQGGLPFSTYPPSLSPPSEWIGYEQDNWQRSQKQEHVLFADEGAQFGHGIPAQGRWRPALNPYWQPNIVLRPQRQPHDYSFLRPFDRFTLGKRNLTGIHYSAAQSASDNHRTALRGMVPPSHRRSTFRLEPVQYGENSMSASASSGEFSRTSTVTSPVADWITRSFRLQ